MIRKTALLTGIASALFIAAPAFAQDAPQTPEPAPAEAAAAQPQSLTLTPGSTVKGAGGAEIGKLVGVQNGANGQELTVRTADGQVRPVPLAGIRQDGSDIVVDASASDVQSTPPIVSDAAEPAPTPDASAAPSADAPTSDEPTGDEPKTDEPH